MNELFIAGIIVFIGILGFIFFSFRRTYRTTDVVDKIRSKNSDLSHYESMRDKLTLRDDVKESEDEEEEKPRGAISLFGGIVSLSIVAIVFANILPMIDDAVNSTNNAFSSTISQSLWGTLQIVIVVGFIFVVLTVFGLGGAGVGEDEEIDIKKKSKRPEKKINKNIRHYTKQRDNLTLRENNNKTEDEENDYEEEEE